MNDNNCPECGALYPIESININEGVALCRQCGRLSRLSDVVEMDRPMEEMFRDPPRGCKISEEGRDVRVIVSMRSVGTFFGGLFAALFWNGIVSVFLLAALGSLYANLVGPLPEGIPFQEEDGMGIGATLGLCLFLVPFVLVGLALIWSVLCSAAGKVEISIGDLEARVRAGVGIVRWQRRFDPRDVRSVTLGLTKWQTNGHYNEVVVIEADRTIRFGSQLLDERREWARAVLHVLLTEKDAGRKRSLLSMHSS